MQVTYELQVVARCPENEGTDVYKVTVRSDRLIKAEQILAVFAPYAKQKIFQEDLTREAAIELDATVESIGVHSGIKTTVSAS